MGAGAGAGDDGGCDNGAGDDGACDNGGRDNGGAGKAAAIQNNHHRSPRPS